jgi:hypothetical protein
VLFQKLVFSVFFRHVLSGRVMERGHRAVGDRRQDFQVSRRRHHGRAARHGWGWRARRSLGAVGPASGKPVCRTPVLTLVQVSLHVPAPAEGLAARRTPVCAAVDVAVMLKRAWKRNWVCWFVSFKCWFIGCSQKLWHYYDFHRSRGFYQIQPRKKLLIFRKCWLLECILCLVGRRAES